MKNVPLDTTNEDGEVKTIRFEYIFSCMEEALQCPRGLHNFLRFPLTSLQSVPFVSCHKKEKPYMEKPAGLLFERSIDDGTIHADGHEYLFVIGTTTDFIYHP